MGTIRAGGKIRSGPLVGKVATSPLPSRGSPPLHSGGQNQKWPTYGQKGYVTPAVSGIPTASERGAKSEMAHKWAKWLRHPCRLGDPHRLRAGGGIRIGPQVGKVATSPLPSRGSPRLQSGKEIKSGPLVGKVAMSPLLSRNPHHCRAGEGNQKWPTSGQSGYVTPAGSGIPTASERGGKSEVAHKWAKWLRQTCRLGDPHRCRARGEIRSGPQVDKVATSPLPARGSPPLQGGGENQKWPTCGQSGYVTRAGSGIPTAAERGGEIKDGPQVGNLATSPLPSRGSPPLHSGGGGGIRSGPQKGKEATSPPPARRSPPLQSRGGGNQKWPTFGQSGYVTPAVSGIPTAAERGGENRKWPTCGQSGYVTPAVSGIPTAAEGGGNQKWPTCGQSGYVTPAVSGNPTAAERGGESEVAHKWAKWLRHPCRLGDPHGCRAGRKSEVAHLWAKWLCHPCCLGIPTTAERGRGIKSGPQVDKVATSPLPARGSPPLQSGGENQKWPTSGQSGYVKPAVSEIPTAAEQGGKSEVAHKWTKWLRHPCQLGDPHRFRAGGKIRSGPLVGKVATSPVPARGSPPLQSGGGKSKMAHKWATWLRHLCRLGDPHRFIAGGGGIRSGPQVGKEATSPPPARRSPPLQSRGGGIRSGPLVGKVATSPLPSRGSPPLQSGGGRIGSGPLVGKVATSPLPSRGSPPLQRGEEIRSGPLVGKVATSPLPSRGSPPLQSGGGNQKWPTSGQSGYVTPAVSGIPTAAERGGNQKWPTCGQSGYVTPAVSGIPTPAERGGESEVAHKWAKWLRHPCRLGDPHRCRAGRKSEVAHLWAKWLRHPCRLGDPHRFGAGGEIRSGPQVGKVATSNLPSRRSPTLQSKGGNQKWPTSGRSGYIHPASSGIPTASQRGGKTQVAHKWAKWLRHPCRLGDPHRLKRGGGGEPEVAHKWTKWLRHPAILGIPTASERGAKSEVAHKWAKWLCHPCRLGEPHRCRAGRKSEVAHLWAKWLRHPCRLGDPHHCRAGGGIKSGPQVDKTATSPLPSRGSPPLQSGGENQKGPTIGQSGYVTPAVSGIPTASERGGNRKWPTCGQSGYVTPAVSGIPTAAERGGNRKWPTCGQSGYVTPAVSGIPTTAERGGESKVAHKWTKWLRHPCRLGDPHRFRAGGGIRSGPQVGKVATSNLPSRRSPPLQSKEENQKWPTSGRCGYVTSASSGIPTASERGGKSEVAHKWAKWLRHPCRLGDPHRFRAVGGENQKWPTSGQGGYVDPAGSGIPTAAERGGGESEVADKLARWLHHPCRLGNRYRFRSGGGGGQKWPRSGQSGYVTPAVSGIPTSSERGGGGIKSGPEAGKVATSPLPARGSPPLESGGQNQKWPTCGQSGYVTAAVSGFPTAAERGGGEQKWPTSGQGGYVTPAGSGIPTASERGGGGDQKWPGSGQSGYVTPAGSGIPTASERGAKSEVAYKWAKWLRHPCRLGDPHRCRAGRGGGIKKWATCGQSGYVTPTVSGIPTGSEQGEKSEVPHLWAKWLRHPCRLKDPHRFKAGRKIRSGPLMGKVATSPLPSRGSPPLQSGGGGGEEVGHLWAKWLCHPYRLGDPHRFRAGRKIRSAPLMG